MDLPEEILAHIFSFLPLHDKCNAFTVCKAWSNTMTHPSSWKDTEVRCESGNSLPERFSDLLPLVRNLKLSMSLTDPANRKTGLCVLRQAVAGGEGQLEALSICCVGNPPLFYAGQDLQQGLVDILTNGSSLTVLDLRGVPFTLNDSFIRSVSMLCPALKSLYINNHSLVCGVNAETLRQALKCCPSLTVLGVFQASLSEDVLKDLMLPQRPALNKLELRCERSLKYTPPLCDQIWSEVKRRHPYLWVELELDHTLPELHVPGVLQPSIPVRCLRLLTWTLLLDEVHLVQRSYANTLEVLELQTPPSPELNSALVSLAKQCVKLREVHCFCVVSQEVITAFITHCPNLSKYTLKIYKEPHPWTCTKLK
ncbi:F-box/LRR-repeat protein 8 [Triplophysa rosa]|uniref:F-box/LRR-repeat protein 8 n=1 Tax=Triplophysa rosa TaxID=992332 RepID=A0A9W7X3R0_TRIRA|nr:F-box/LRR-repeat protein 8 [Triplophysa rosa]KAI7814052.1 F-box/LRR-repeat protein 8 [Triplophysa rosa]